MQCHKLEKGEKASKPNSNCVIAIGFKDLEFEGEKKTFVEGILMCNKENIADEKVGWI